MALAPFSLKQSRKPDCTVLPDGRRRLVDYRLVGAGANLTDDLIIAKGTLYPTESGHTAVAGYSALRLVDQRINDNAEGKTELVSTYEQIHQTAETVVGNPTTEKLEDGRTAKVFAAVQFSANAFVPGTVGAVHGSDASLYLLKVEAPDNGTVRDIKRFYVTAGTIAQHDEELHNGKLLKRTITSVITVPATPGGYIQVGTPVQNPNGLPIYTYSFYKGDGEISRKTAYGQSDDEGVTGNTTITIQHLTAPSVSSQPTSSPGGGFALVLFDKNEQSGHRLWTAYWAKGTGLVAQTIGRGPAGLRRVTNISLGTKVTPDGIVEEDGYRIAEGYKIFTVTSVQTAAGGADPTAITVAVEKYVPFTYPGRAKAYSEVVNGFTFLDVFQDPPVTAKVKATVTISYVITTTLGTISNLWNPMQWACIRSQWVGFGPEPGNLVKALPGYRSVSDTPVTETASGSAPSNLSVFGNTVFGGEDATIIVTGGPEDPGGNTYTLDAFIEEDPAFTSSAGTKYHRKIVITAAIPAQAALPV